MKLKSLLLLPLIIFPTAAIAIANTPDGSNIDWNSIVLALIGGAFTLLGTIATLMINSKIADKNAANALSKAVVDSLGIVQNAIDNRLSSHPLQLSLNNNVGPPIAAATQYVIDNASAEMIRLKVSPDEVATTIDAKLGLAKMTASMQSDPIPPIK